MKDFSICKGFMKGFIGIDKRDNFYIGLTPGKFDTKQIVLCVLAILKHRENRHVNFVRTTDREVLKKCNCFINDDFVTLIPHIPSYFNVKMVWDDNYAEILRQFSVHDTSMELIVRDMVFEKLCDFESMDFIMNLYDPNDSDGSFEKALNIFLELFSNAITRTVRDTLLIPTINANICMMEENYIKIPLYVENWRSGVLINPEGYKVEYAILPDDDGMYLVESMDKTFLMKKYIKGMKNVAYSGRFYAKVADIDTAKEIISKLPTFVKEIKHA